MRFLLAGCLIVLASVVACTKEHGVPQPAAEAPKVGVEQLALKVDPYCGMSLEGHPLAAAVDYKGKTYGFCSAYCKDEFVKDSEKYLAKVGQGGMASP